MIDTLYFKVENMIFKQNKEVGFRRYENGKWVHDSKWFEKINFSDFTDYEEISEKEALDYIKKN